MKFLPDRFPESWQPVWAVPLSSRGLGGVAVAGDHVVASSRNLTDEGDEFICFNRDDGEFQWIYEYPCEGELDYGNSPRATPLIHRDFVFVQGAFGHLACLALEDGTPVWETNLVDEFESELLTWGCCWSPILVDGKLIVQPGAKDASLVALDPEDGRVIWKTPGAAGAYCSPIIVRIGETKQIVAYDATTLGGWDVETGERLWTLTPEFSSDFNVSTPIHIDDRLFVATENNGARIFEFGEDGILNPEPVAVFEDFAPDTHTPIIIGDRVLGTDQAFQCLSTKDLKSIYSRQDDAYLNYCAVVATETRALVIAADGTLVLLDIGEDAYRELDRFSLTELVLDADEAFDPAGDGNAQGGGPGERIDEIEIHSHPAFSGERIYIRLGSWLVALDMTQ